jgi:endonuclease-3
MVTPELFKRFPTPEAMAEATFEELFEYIRSVSYPNSKTRHLIALSQKLVSDFGGEVPSDIESLMTLPGVGRKTANVVASVVYNEPVIAVDTHVFRVSHRLGLSDGKTPLAVETELEKHIPVDKRATAHHWLILHGRYVCTAKSPRCTECGLSDWCREYSRNKS